MYALYLYNTESSFDVRAKESLLLYPKNTFMHDTGYNNVVLCFLESILNMKLTSIILFLQISLRIWKLKIIKEILEKLNTFMSLAADLENRAHHLALHLFIY